MADVKRDRKWLNESELDAVLLPTAEARAAYEDERLLAKVGKALRHARKQAHLSQIEVAALAGVDQGDLSKLETAQGVRGASLVTIEKVARALHMRVDITFLKEGDELRPDDQDSAIMYADVSHG